MRQVPLPDLALDDVEVYGQALLDIQAGGDPAGTGNGLDLPAILGWLWDAIVEPVIDSLPATDEPSRLWWLPTGLLGSFPLHAAGHSGRPGALDAVVSSYVPTLRALAHARSRPPATARRQLVVALARTRGMPDLPGAAAEADDLQKLHPGTPLSDQRAIVDEVL